MTRPAPPYELFMLRGPLPGTVFPLAGKNMTIGRDPVSDIAIGDPEVSRQHALVISAPGSEYQIQDLGSTNGTFVDGVRLRSRPEALRPFAVITMGSSVTLIFRESSINERDGSDDMASSPDEAPQLEAAHDDQVQDLSYGKRSQEKQLPEGDLPQGPPLTEAKRPKQRIDEPPHSLAASAPEALSLAAQSEPEESNELSPNVILGLVLLLLCSCAAVLVFLVYLRGDWLLRQIGLVP